MSAHGSESVSPSPDDGDSRRSFVGKACGVTMVGALTVSYGTLFTYAGQFLFPSKPTPKAWMFVIDVVKMKVGDSLSFKTPGGARVAIARQGEKGDVADFIALSSTCPHLGCQVHWEGQSNRFFCPCHNGAFDPKGKAISGPPADAGQSLPQFPLKVENGLLFIEVETVSLAAADFAPSQTLKSPRVAGAEGSAQVPEWTSDDARSGASADSSPGHPKNVSHPPTGEASRRGFADSAPATQSQDGGVA